MAGIKGQVQQRGVARRRAIIEAAIELFSVHGYRGTGIAAIAEKAGITASGVLHHFGSKEALLEAVIQERDQREVERLKEFRRQRGVEAMRRTYAQLAEDIEAERELAALYVVLLVENLNPGDPLHDFFKKRTRVVRSDTRRALEHAKELGEIRGDVDVRAVADEIVAFQEGIQLTWLQDPDRIDLKKTYTGYVDALLDRLAPS